MVVFTIVIRGRGYVYTTPVKRMEPGGRKKNKFYIVIYIVNWKTITLKEAVEGVDPRDLFP